jgi:membrane protease YdiL (CAAX protease family)
MRLILLANLAATLLMTGTIWTIQLVHYPLFNRVGTEAFRDYAAAHTSAITCLVLPLMAVELLTALGLVAQPLPEVPHVWFWIGLGLVGVAWLMTAFVHVPQHGQLASGFDEVTYQALVTTNWVRTIAWTARSALMLYVVNQVIA